MVKAKLRPDNARTPEQRQRMERLAKEIGCFFCKDNYLKVGASSAIYQAKYWYIKKNDYPYKGAVHHYLIASKKHRIKITDITPIAWTELLKVIKWLENHLKIKGASLFVRSGDMSYTGATLDHIHFHLLLGAKKKKGGILKDNILVTLGHKKRA
jgi:diadenosine tetraphosphate (Ap4A) HIT family hydrolase